MPHRTTGHYVAGALAGSRYQAFVPGPLPPVPALDFAQVDLVARKERADQALGRFEGITLMLPDPELLLHQYVRKEALLSSQIEGAQSSLSDLLLFEMDAAPGVLMDDVEEVSNYVAALNHGLRRLREDDFPLSLRLIREMHALLLQGGRGASKQPGEFRRSQVWVGGASPALAHLVSPPPDAVPGTLAALEQFLHAPPGQIPPLVKAALAHVQFETIHPFSDGHGRLGRLLITLILCSEGVLREPSLYLSLYFKRRRADYYDRLNAVRLNGDWEGWLGFFLDGVAETAQQAVDAAQRLLALLARDRARIAALGKRVGNVGLVFEQFARRVVLAVPQVAPHLSLSVPTIRAAVRTLQELKIVNKLTGQQRHRIFAYQAYLDILSEGAQPL
ncbi:MULTISPECIES: Fic family protein [Xanthomonas]|uniref:Protein adenylyltransferase n=2 Tax=Xanthomonas TaxID=338 RepID=A0A7Z7J3J3_XANCH|nr:MULTISPECIES: Fic family protein [Xanthomonas]ATS37268.1 Fic family protein [Xanthomonas citri pv. phaseoli var. fuscans]ATS43921.1 Fic family protein [Xanthomonas citri pv. phaseoli var. fuscans]ATS45269.1 Fic family protein [Xanthomonas citri pv. phaseoli var. fuscans]ATS84463.1 Fic family protein [Xanthomonas citri pv. phaseoli var. fuscans]QWN18942.1 Fic family protein [Xanthomonas citri]